MTFFWIWPWSVEIANLIWSGTHKFINEYSMPPSAHGHLVHLLDSLLQHCEYNNCSSESILVEHIVSVGLRGLRGRHINDQRYIIVSSKLAAYNAFDDFVDAMNMLSKLDVTFLQLA